MTPLVFVTIRLVSLFVAHASEPQTTFDSLPSVEVAAAFKFAIEGSQVAQNFFVSLQELQPLLQEPLLSGVVRLHNIREVYFHLKCGCLRLRPCA